LWGEIEELLHILQSTLRSRLAKSAQNGAQATVEQYSP
jgi:hypothetical protein